MRALSFKLASIICLIFLLLATSGHAENETTSVIIILREQPIFELHEKALKNKAREIEPSQKAIKNIVEEARMRLKTKKAGKKSVLREMSENERTIVTTEALKIRTFRDEARKDAIRETQKIISSQQNILIEKINVIGGKVNGRGLFFNTLYAEVPSSKIAEITSFPEVESVEVSRRYTVLLDVSTKAIYADAFWNASYNGTGVAIAIVDTGVNASHTGLSGQVIDAKDFVVSDSDGNTTDDLNGHGTHVAGIAASKDATYKGISFGASIINAKAYNSTCDCFYDSDIMNSLDWAIYNATGGAEIISASLGGSDSGYDSLSRFFDAVVELGVFVSVAAGNDGPSGNTINSPGISYNSITVGSIDDKNTVARGDDSIASDSSRGPIPLTDRIKPDIVAPGTGITSLSNLGSGFATSSGTSMATPHVSGAAALVMSAGVTDPREVKALLINNAEDMGDAGVDNNYGWGYVDLNKTLYHLSDVRLATVNTSNKTLYFKGYAVSGDKATIAWNKHHTYSGPSGDYSISTAKVVTDLDLYLYSTSSGTQISNSTRQYSNVEQGQSNINDTLVVKIFAYSFGTDLTSETFALATGEGFTLTSPPSLNSSLLVPTVIPLKKNVTVELKITNTGGVKAHSVTATIDLPDGLTLLSENKTDANGIENASTGTVNWTIQAMIPGTYSLNASLNSTSYGETINTTSSNITTTESNLPSIIITSPLNGTYYGNISLNFTVEDESDVSSIWYSLNDGVNTTTGNTTLSLCSDTYSLRLYANDSSGNLNSTTVGFTVRLIQNLNTTTNYTSIQAAVGNASVGDTISVGCGNYSENVDINKSINLIGGGTNVTIINASNSSDHVFEITADWVNVSGFTVTGATKESIFVFLRSSGVYLLNSDHSKVEEVNATENQNGIILSSSNYNILKDNAVSNNALGIGLQSANYNNITNNGANSNIGTAGIYLGASNNNSIRNNTFNSNDLNGIWLSGSHNNTLANNIVNFNMDDGIYFSYSTSNILTNNTVSGQIYLDGGSNDNILIENKVSVNFNYGIILYQTVINNTIYHNNFIINDYSPAFDDGNNTWDNGYPSGGNYWSNWISPDVNGDGVVDSPFNISGGNNQDRYPVTTQNGWLNIIEDITPPNITIISPENTTYNSSSIALNYSLSSDLISSTFYNINGTTNIILTGNTIVSISREGQHNLTIYSNDTFGNINSSMVWFTLDTIPPSVFNVSTDPSQPVVDDNVNITANVSDAHLDTVFANITYPNGTAFIFLMSGGSVYGIGGGLSTTVFNVSEYGTYTARVVANDTAGNINDTANITFYAINSYSNTTNVTNGSTVAAINKSDLIIEVTANETKNATVNIKAKLAPSSSLFALVGEINSSSTDADQAIKYLNVTNTTDLSNLSRIKIRMYYTGSEVIGLDNNTLAIYYWNGTNWFKCSDYEGSTIPKGPFVYDTGHDTTNQYVWAEVNRFSIYGMAGDIYVAPTPTTTTSSGGGGGGGSPSPITLLSAGANELTSETYYDVLITLSAGGKINKDRFIETSDTLAGPLLLTKKYPLPTDPTAAQFARTVESVTGEIYTLAAEASEDISFKYGALENKLVIARGDLGVDSMAAVAYAKAKNIPILLVKPNELPSVTEEAISKFMAVRKRDIIIIGGPVAVSTAVEEKLLERGDVKRIYGETRIETAVALAEEAFTNKNKVRAIVITDYTNPRIDAVLMSYVLDAPLLYVKSDTLSPVVKEYISNHKETIFGHTKIVLMGVDPKVSAEIDELIK